MTSMQNREKVILAKYIQAEDVRETRKVIRDTIEFMKFQPKMNLYNISKYQVDLEERLEKAWKDRQDKLNHLTRKQNLETIDNITVLHRKIRREAHDQEQKIIRREKPAKPKLDPLPYLKKIRENLCKSMDAIETPTPARTPTPEDKYITKKVQFELINTSKRTAFQRQETKKFYTNIKAKV